MAAMFQPWMAFNRSMLRMVSSIVIRHGIVFYTLLNARKCESVSITYQERANDFFGIRNASPGYNVTKEDIEIL